MKVPAISPSTRTGVGSVAKRQWAGGDGLDVLPGRGRWGRDRGCRRPIPTRGPACMVGQRQAVARATGAPAPRPSWKELPRQTTARGFSRVDQARQARQGLGGVVGRENWPRRAKDEPFSRCRSATSSRPLVVPPQRALGIGLQHNAKDADQRRFNVIGRGRERPAPARPRRLPHRLGIIPSPPSPGRRPPRAERARPRPRQRPPPSRFRAARGSRAARCDQRR